ncbi:hypothetical protein J4463_01245 [Candidatus Pacearchaeota archaeon]|nr:hypothetical protein [Candidatus Pacearchaeota archaeon]
MLQNYQQIAEKISRASGLSIDEIDRRVEAKCAKLSGLISKEGSAQIVASELGISFEKEKMKVSELAAGMKRVNILGKIITEPMIRSYSKNGREGKVASLTVADETGNIRVVLWDTNHIGLFESGKIKQGNTVEISNAAVRNDELHLSGFSYIKPSTENIENVNTEISVHEKKISELASGQNAVVRAFLVQIFEPRFFDVCPECGKKAANNLCAVHGNVISRKRALVGVVLDDGYENMRGVMFNEQIENLGITNEELENPELFFKKREALIGEEAFFTVNVRNNNLFNTTELIVNNIERIDIDRLINSLQTK